MGRMDKYSSNESNKRTLKNQKLYDEVSDINIDYIDINYNNAIEINPNSLSRNSREDFQKVKQLGGLIMEKERDIVTSDVPKEEKIYDINEILKKAKESTNFEEDKKKRLISTEYNILSKLDIKELEQEDLSKDDLHKIIDTIYDNEGKRIPRKAPKAKRYDDSNLLDDMVDDDVETIEVKKEEDAADTQIELKNSLVLTEDLSKMILEDEQNNDSSDDLDTTVKNEVEETSDDSTLDSDEDMEDTIKEKKKKRFGRSKSDTLTDTMLQNIERTDELRKLEKKSKVSLVIILIIILALLIVGGYLLYKYFSA